MVVPRPPPRFLCPARQEITPTLSKGQSRKADFQGYVGPIRNGWDDHLVVFSRNVIEEGSGWFEYDDRTGTVTILRDSTRLQVECWWRGRAPWGYLFLSLWKNLDPGHHQPFVGKHELEAAEWERRARVPGHLLETVDANVGDRFSVSNKPAHMHGSPAVFELSLHASRAPPVAPLDSGLEAGAARLSVTERAGGKKPASPDDLVKEAFGGRASPAFTGMQPVEALGPNDRAAKDLLSDIFISHCWCVTL